MSADKVIQLPNTNDERGGRGDATVHRDNFVERGCEFTVDFDSGICYVDRGIIHYAYNGTYYRVEVNTATSSNELTLEASASHDVYYDFANEQLVATTGTAPAEPRLKIGTVDTATETFDDTHNRDPTRFGKMGSGDNPVTVTADSISTDTINGLPSEYHLDEDANSPLEFTQAQTGTITLDGEYELIELFVSRVDGSTAAETLELQIDGATAGYVERLRDGTQVTSSSSVTLGRIGDGSQQILSEAYVRVTGRFPNFAFGNVILGDTDGSAASVFNTSATTEPVDSITLMSSGTATFDLTAHVYGIPKGGL